MRRDLRNEHIAWQKYKKWQAEHADEIREGQFITRLGGPDGFQELYRNIGRRIDLIKYQVTHQASRKTLQTLNKMYREYTKTDENPKGRALPREAWRMSTREIAKLFNNDISDYYHKTKEELIKGGVNVVEATKKAKMAVATHYFGS